MSRRKRKRRSQSEVELNLAAMLDMAFQLLAFFILTFRPSPIEGEISVNMPPPTPITNAAMTIAEADPTGNAIPLMETLPITIQSDGGEGVGSVALGERVIFDGEITPGRLQLLDRELQALLSLRATPYDQVQIRVDPAVRYEDVMRIMDVCTKQRFSDGTPLNKISFLELEAN